MLKYKALLQIKSKIIKLIPQNLIFECLRASSLLITDFSSVIFDFMAQNKPFIIYIHDSEDSKLNIILKINIFQLKK